MAIPFLSGLIGILIFSYLLDRVSRITIMFITYLINGMSLAGLIFAQNYWTLFVLLALIGFTYSSFTNSVYIYMSEIGS